MLFVFDLDFTLWNCGGTWCDHTQPPNLKRSDHIVDAEGRIISLYRDVRFILETLKNQNVDMAIASNTTNRAWTEKLMELFDIGKFFSYREIHLGSKRFHIESLHLKTGFPYSEMYFFDDEVWNIKEVQKLGVNCVFIENGLLKSIDALAKTNPVKSII